MCVSLIRVSSLPWWAHRVFKGWGEDAMLRDTLQTSDFSEFEPWEAVLIYWVGESPAVALK